MNNFARAHNSYLEPPDDDPICENGCGETLHHGEWSEDWYCTNKFCPLKFQGVEQEMAYKLVETLEENRTLSLSLQKTKRELAHYVRRDVIEEENRKRAYREWDWSPNMDAE